MSCTWSVRACVQNFAYICVIAHTTGNFRHTKDIFQTATLLQECYIKTHTKTLHIAKFYFYFFIFKACKFVCGLSDVLIKLLMMMIVRRGV